MHFSMEGWGLFSKATQSHQKGGFFLGSPSIFHEGPSLCMHPTPTGEPQVPVIPGTVIFLLALPVKEASPNEFPKLIRVLLSFRDFLLLMHGTPLP